MKDFHNLLRWLFTGSRWQLAVVAASLLAMAAHLALRAFPVSFLDEDIPLLAVIIAGGIPLVLGILRKLSRGDFGTDMLAAVSLVTAVWLDQYLAATLVILMLSGGGALEAFAMRKAASVLSALAGRMPSIAHRRHGDRIEDIAISDIQVGDSIVVYPHETAPVDGTVTEGRGSMDESYLTGEPYRISKVPGAAVISGAINGETVLTVLAERLPSDSRYARIMKVMQEAEQKRPVLRRLGDQIGAVFTPLALILAAGAWYATGDSVRFLSVLVIATPCPLLIAIPVTLISAISMAARRGIVIRDPVVLERLPTCRTAIFDKTGTLTYGEPELTEIIPAEGMDRDSILQQVASLERYSKHPLAGAVLKAAEQSRLFLPEAEQVSEKPGQGLTGVVAGSVITVTHRNRLSQIMPEMASLIPPAGTGLECLILRNGEYAATFRFHDAPRREGKSFISHLSPRHHFRKVMLVSGDRESEVAYLAHLLGIQETLSSQSPEQKLAVVRAETAKAPTLFMGDGINDAPALAAATVGIAFGHGNVTAEAAGAVILDNTLIKVDELFHISAAMRRIALQSALGGMVLSLAGMAFAAGGFIPPVMGALLQEGIDILAILNALRLTWGTKVKTDLPGTGRQSE
ncbi:MAG: heavy metal translocating P-type ATPase [Pseudomonadota bacterium]|nr:heavy metal translocating P-type ATPase [Pseudomonadota bacterium]